MYPVEGHSIRQMYQSFQANTLKDVQENPFLPLLDKLLRCALQDNDIPSGEQGEAEHFPPHVTLSYMSYASLSRNLIKMEDIQ